MPFRSANPIVNLELSSMHTIDTQNVENLFGLWSGMFNSLVAALLHSADPLSQCCPNALAQWKMANG
jgi:hypothetical protein